MTREEAKNKIAEECGTSVCNNREGGVLLRVNGGVVIPNLVNEIKRLVDSNCQVILTGAPGTGKTYTARKVALEITGEADYSVKMASDLLPKMIELAQTEKTVRMLADEIERNKRRVNALEYVMIPQLEETIKYIKDKLDENERAAVVRLMKVKGKN